MWFHEDDMSIEEFDAVFDAMPDMAESQRERESWSTFVESWPCGCVWIQCCADRDNDSVCVCDTHAAALSDEIKAQAG